MSSLKVINKKARLVELRRNKKRELKLEVTKAEDPVTCSGCYLFMIKRHCEIISEDFNLCESEDIIYKKAYED